MDIMFDLETLSSAPTAGIVQIGAYAFEPYGDDSERMVPNRSFLVNVEDALEAGPFTASTKTIMWWLEQSDAARRSLTFKRPMALMQALLDFAEFVRRHLDNEGHLWNHSTFDAPILHRAFDIMKVERPWAHRDVLDLRTLTRLFPAERGDNPVAHSAEWDSWAQSVQVQRSLAIKGGLHG